MKKLYVVIVAGLLIMASSSQPHAASDVEARMEALEKRVHALSDELAAARAELSKPKQENYVDNTVDETGNASGPYYDKSEAPSGITGRFNFGAYGEMHANFTEGDGGDKFDIHRFVLNTGYDFADWIKLGSEVEVEHAFVSSGSDGELKIEQLYVDFLLHDALSVRAGRMLAPLGITNQRHEPTAFNGVERPSFDKYILPTTWSIDGIGLYGNITDVIRYQAYVVTGLDGTKFDSTDGIRDGRIGGMSSFNDIAFTGRLDYFPLLQSDVPVAQDLRLGASFYYGGINNGNEGKDPGLDGSVTVLSGDMETGVKDVDVKGAVAYTIIEGAEKIPGVAKGIFGYNVEAGYHFLPDSLKTGKLERSDAVVFARYDNFDTQFKMPHGVAKDPAGDRQEWTFGISFYPVPNLVLKADYQIRDSKALKDQENLINLGIGFQL